MIKMNNSQVHRLIEKGQGLSWKSETEGVTLFCVLHCVLHYWKQYLYSQSVFITWGMYLECTFSQHRILCPSNIVLSLSTSPRWFVRKCLKSKWSSKILALFDSCKCCSFGLVSRWESDDVDGKDSNAFVCATSMGDRDEPHCHSFHRASLGIFLRDFKAAKVCRKFKDRDSSPTFLFS